MQALSRSQLRTMAPSVFTRSAYHRMSERYKPAFTADVVDLLEGIGLLPVRAQQSRCRLPDKRDYVKHMIRFRRSEDMDADRNSEIAEVVLTNSFDGSTAYNLMLGLLRVVCTNGLVCPIGDLGGFSVRHKGGDDFNKRIIEASYRVVEEAPKALETVAAWKQLSIPAPAQLAYAEAAAVVIGNPHIQPAQLLVARRPEDAPDAEGNRSLYATFNCAQEHAMKGGISNRTNTGRRTTSRAITAVSRDVSLNKALWTLSDRLSKVLF